MREAATTRRPVLVAYSTTVDASYPLPDLAEFTDVFERDVDVATKTKAFVCVRLPLTRLGLPLPANRVGEVPARCAFAVYDEKGAVLLYHPGWLFDGREAGKRAVLAALELSLEIRRRLHELPAEAEEDARSQARYVVLADALRRPDVATRVAAANAVGHAPSEEARLLLKFAIDGLRADQGEVRFAVLGAVLRLGLPSSDASARTAVTKALSDRDDRVFQRAASGIGGFGKLDGASASALVAGLLVRSRHDTSWNAIQAMKEDGAAAAPLLGKLVETSDDQNVRSRSIALLKTLGRGAAGAVPTMNAILLEDPGRDVASRLYERFFRDCAYEILDHVGADAKAALPGLLAVLARKDFDRIRAIGILAGLGDAARPALPALRRVAAEPGLEQAANFAIRRIEAASRHDGAK